LAKKRRRESTGNGRTRKKEITFRAAPLDGGYADTALHDLVELGLDVQLRVLRLDAFQLDSH
jgi:hypothetical protein